MILCYHSSLDDLVTICFSDIQSSHLQARRHWIQQDGGRRLRQKANFMLMQKSWQTLGLIGKWKSQYKQRPANLMLMQKFLVDREMKITVNKNNAMFRFWLVGKWKLQSKQHKHLLWWWKDPPKNLCLIWSKKSHNI